MATINGTDNSVVDNIREAQHRRVEAERTEQTNRVNNQLKKARVTSDAKSHEARITVPDANGRFADDPNLPQIARLGRHDESYTVSEFIKKNPGIKSVHAIEERISASSIPESQKQDALEKLKGYRDGLISVKDVQLRVRQDGNNLNIERRSAAGWERVDDLAALPPEAAAAAQERIASMKEHMTAEQFNQLTGGPGDRKASEVMRELDVIRIGRTAADNPESLKNTSNVDLEAAIRAYDFNFHGKPLSQMSGPEREQLLLKPTVNAAGTTAALIAGGSLTDTQKQQLQILHTLLSQRTDRIDRGGYNLTPPVPTSGL